MNYQATPDGMIEKGAEQPKVQDVIAPESTPEELTLGAASSDAPASTTVAEAATEGGSEEVTPEASTEPEAQIESTPEEGEAKSE